MEGFKPESLLIADEKRKRLAFINPRTFFIC